jgi:succinoglycan biosynthesis transport protein ExoP
MQTGPQPADFSATWAAFRASTTRYLLLLRRRWWVVFLTASLGLAGAAWYVHMLPPSYRSVAQIVVGGQLQLQDGVNYSEENANFLGTQSELMQSGEVQNRAANKVAAEHPEVRRGEIELTAELKPLTNIFILQAVGEDAQYTQLFLDAALDEFIKFKREMRSEKSESTLAGISDELVATERELRQAEDELLAFQKQNNIGYLQEEGNSAGAYLATLNRQLADLKTEHQLLGMLDLDQNLDRKGITPEEATKADQAALRSGGPASDYLKARQQLQLLEAERDQFAQYMRPKHPTIIELEEKITQTQKLIETFRTQTIEQIKSRQEGIRLQIENLQGTIKEYEIKALDLSERIGQYEKIKSKVDRMKLQYERLFASLRSVDVTQNVSQDTLTILNRASRAESVKPTLLKSVLIGVGVGALVGLLFLFFLDRIDDRITTLHTVQQRLSEPVLGQIPLEAHNGPLQPIQHSDARHAFSESFRTLRSSLLFATVPGERPKTFLVTSSVPTEGKSTVAANLAITLGFAGSRTLLVDADLRRGSVHQAFACDNTRGFSDVLRQELPWQEAIVESGIENLSLLPRGAALTHPSEHLLSPTAERVVRELRAEYEFVIFDSAPTLVADDTPSFAPKMDAILFVLRQGFSSMRLTTRAIALLRQRQANVFGLVFNGLDVSHAEYGYYRYKEYHQVSSES